MRFSYVKFCVISAIIIAVSDGEERGMMYQCGDLVMYGIHGVCKILELEKRKVDRKYIEYYVLEPTDQPGTRFYVPTHNESAVAKMRPMLTQEELETMLRAEDTCKDAWIVDENQRKQYYRELINSGDRKSLIRMVITLHKHKLELLQSGRKFHICDENFLKDAEKLIGSEFSVVLNIDQDEVGTYIQNFLKE